MKTVLIGIGILAVLFLLWLVFRNDSPKVSPTPTPSVSSPVGAPTDTPDDFPDGKSGE